MINYKPVQKLYESSNSVVLKVVDKNNADNSYALKLIGPLSSDLNRIIFKREIQALKSLNKYDDIVKIYDTVTGVKFQKWQDMGAILLQYIEGCRLDQVNFNELSELNKFNICLKICRAIQNAHSNGILHRDIKPENIMYDNGDIKIIDFGSSKLKSIVERETTTPFYTNVYSAKEVVNGGMTLESSDVYSLGVVFYEIFLNTKAKSQQAMADNILQSNLICDIKELLLNMIADEADDRIQSVSEVIDTLIEVIGSLNTDAFKFTFNVSYDILSKLKKALEVEEKMTLSQFNSVFLVKEFNNLYGFYNEKDDQFKFIGDHFYMEAILDSQVFRVTNMYSIPIDRRQKLRKKYFETTGKITFYSSRTAGVNDNAKLKVMLQNHNTRINSKEYKSSLFEDLFGKWRESLFESIDNSKSKNGKVLHDNFEIIDNTLYIYVKEYINNSIDDINPETRYVLEKTVEKKIKVIPVGIFESITYVNDEIQLKISLDSRAPKQEILSLLKKGDPVLEDYQYKITSFKRQLSAIIALQNDECSSKNFKDIVLELEAPTSTPSIKTLAFYSDKLDNPQKEAVIKALNSDTISLIQGPPGTGKTTVINEIINQIILNRYNSKEQPKILIVSQSHTAVDNILSGMELLKSKSNVRILRIGPKGKINEDVEKEFSINSTRQNILAKIREDSKKYLEQKLEVDTDKDKWGEIKLIQEEWLKRCGDLESFDYQIINSATIVAGTCIGYLSNEHIRDLTFDYVIIDEAAKATTPELLVSVIKADKIILVGDHHQLPPYADKELSKISYELVKNPKYRLFDILFTNLPATHKQILTIQYRMIRNIGDLISIIFYDGTIITGVDDEDRQHNIPYFKNKSIVWFNTSLKDKHQQNKEKGGSYINLAENDVIKELMVYFNSLDNANELDIGIITGYSAQRNLINKSITNKGLKNIGHFEINTLDAFQGRQNDIIVYSTVRTDRSIGFQQEKERINVAFSRARKLLVICGDLDFFYSWDSRENRFVDIINYIRENSEECSIIDCNGGNLFGEIH